MNELAFLPVAEPAVMDLSEEGREVTLFRLYPGELCVLSASCVISQITFDIIWQNVQLPRSYKYFTNTFFFFPSGSSTILDVYKRQNEDSALKNAKAGRLLVESPRYVDCYNCSVRNPLRQRG